MQLASNQSDLFCPRIPADPEVTFNAFSLSQFATPFASPATSRNHSRQGSRTSVQSDSPKPFLNSLFSSRSFSSLFSYSKPWAGNDSTNLISQMFGIKSASETKLVNYSSGEARLVSSSDESNGIF